MSKRFDINAKNDRSFGHSNRYTNKVTTPNLNLNENNDNQNNEQPNNNTINSVNNNINSKRSAFNIRDNDIGEISDVKLKIPTKTKVILISAIVLILFFAFLLVFVTVLIDNSDSSTSSLATSGYYAMRCPEVTVYMADKSKGYEIVDTATYPLEEYVAGVVRGEVGMLNNLEIYKEFALSARTYFLANENGDCSIESSDRRQVFIPEEKYPYYSDLIHQAVEETKGQVVLSNNELFTTFYDAFCSIDVDDEYYTLKQKNQKIPRSWADSQSGIAESWKQGTCAGNHGMGISAWGSYYLATMEGYDYLQLLNYYLGDHNITISSRGFTSSIQGLEIKNTTDAQELHDNLGRFLNNNGSSIDELNDFIKTNVKNNGAGSRAGVVTAAVTLINYLYDGGHVRLPYYWGGNYQHIGVNPDFGNQISASVSIYGKAYYYSGFDCSGFASWAIKNGGYNFSRHTTTTFHNEFSGDSCLMSDSSCIGQPGDLINSSGCHVQMIVSVDEASNKYYIAESTGGLGLVMQQANMHSGICGNNTRIIHMDNFYENKANVDNNY